MVVDGGSVTDAVQVIHGDSRVELARLAEASVDAVVTDTPYALESIVRRFGAANAAPAKGGVYGRSAAGFMGQKWDTGAEAFDPAFWREVYRVMKPGAWLAAFGGTRTCHRLATAIEVAGFEIRDQLEWLHGQGYPKSHSPLESMLSLPRTIDRARWYALHRLARRMSASALKPAVEPVVLARKPPVGNALENLLVYGVVSLNVNGCRIPTDDELRAGAGGLLSHVRDGKPWPRQREGEPSAGRRYYQSSRDGFTMLPGAREGHPLGRWPANVLHDGSPEVLALFPEAPGQRQAVTGDERSPITTIFGDMGNQRRPALPRDAGGSAARFYYCAKADDGDRMGSRHPTVKPLALMRWLVRLVTPPGGVVLDPFAGTGSTGIAARAEGMRSILIERETAYVADIRRRLAWVEGEAGHSRVLRAQRRTHVPVPPTPLFGEAVP